MIILALDALGDNLVEKFNCKNLMQEEYGRTDLSKFNLARTVVLWASFLTGKNMESKIPIKGQWKFQLKRKDTFFKFFKTFKAIDVPSFSLKQKNHEKERKLLKEFFKDESILENYNSLIWNNHNENKKDFFNSLGKFDVIMAYFDLADAIGHLNFGNTKEMRIVYKEIDLMIKQINIKDTILIVSDHGMESVGRFGDHTKNGFYSINKKLNLKNPKITDFFNIIKTIT